MPWARVWLRSGCCSRNSRWQTMTSRWANLPGLKRGSRLPSPVDSAWIPHGEGAMMASSASALRAWIIMSMGSILKVTSMDPPFFQWLSHSRDWALVREFWLSTPTVRRGGSRVGGAALWRIEGLVNRLAQNEFRRAGVQENGDFPAGALSGQGQHVGDEDLPRDDAAHEFAGEQAAADFAVARVSLELEWKRGAWRVFREKRKDFQGREEPQKGCGKVSHWNGRKCGFGAWPFHPGDLLEDDCRNPADSSRSHTRARYGKFPFGE